METSSGCRQSIRLKNYDYSQPGYYFVTICTWNRLNIFGDIDNAQMDLNLYGKMVEKAWGELKVRFPDAYLDEFEIMPNHFHGIIAIVGAPLVGARGERAGTRPAPTLGAIIGAFKSITARQFILSLKDKKNHSQLWQRNYYEHVIRNEKELFELRQYIQQNPLKWELDPENVGAPLVGARSERPGTRPAPTI